MVDIITRFRDDSLSPPFYLPIDFAEGSANRLKYAAQATMRLNFFPLVDACLSKNIKAKIWNLESENFSSFAVNGESKIIIMYLGPSLKPGTCVAKNMSDLIGRLNKNQKNITLFYGDNFMFRQDSLALCYKKLIKNSTNIISHSRYLLDLVGDVNKSAQLVQIPDPCVLNRCSFHFTGKEQTCRIIWFGQGANKSFLLRNLPRVLLECKSCEVYELSLLTRSYDLNKIAPKIQRIINQITADAKIKTWKFRMVPWDSSDQPAQLERELKRAHISFIPSDPSHPWKAGASANRLVDSIQTGCIPVASPLQSYKEMESVSLQGEDFAYLIDNAWKNRCLLAGKYNQEVGKFLDKYSLSEVIRQWIQAVAYQ